jgi:hypothetical protein
MIFSFSFVSCVTSNITKNDLDSSQNAPKLQNDYSKYSYSDTILIDEITYFVFSEYRSWSKSNNYLANNKMEWEISKKTRVRGEIISIVTIEVNENLMLVSYKLHSKYNNVSYINDDLFNNEILPSWISNVDFIKKDIDNIIKKNKALQFQTNKENELKNIGSPIFIIRSRIIGPNSAGGVNVGVFFRNISEKKIKYIYFTIVPYNRVGDIVRCTISGRSSVRLEKVGFISPDEYSKDYEVWANVWYNHNVSSIKITNIEIIFEDDSKQELKNNMIENITFSIDEYNYWNNDYYRDGR